MCPQRLRDGQARCADGGKQAADQADGAGPGDAGDDQAAAHGEPEHDLTEIAA